jgi:DNA-directed RNA polymerase beta subunit
MKMVKVFVAVKRKIPAGRQDGRPSRQQGRGVPIVPEEDMPFLEDGRRSISF